MENSAISARAENRTDAEQADDWFVASVLSVRQDADGCASSVITESAYDSGLPVSETWSHGDL